TNITSTSANGAYAAGAVIPITVTFTEAVTVTGTPRLTLNSGAVVDYSSGSGTTTLTFNYTVAAGQNSADLDYSSATALALNGGTIRDAGGNNATLTLAAPGASGSLGANKNIVIGTVIPVTVTFSEAVIVTGTPRLALNSGATIDYVSGSGTSALLFNYTVAGG